ncbi:MAG: acyltransferase [Schwartzia sp.]|nr:acyltransferase [Schwartzia sp. (in: firmicutes)]
MNKPRLDAIEYIRGISMLGVIGIHVGSQYLSNPTPNPHLVALFEIATRFSVPIFFFISAFGLFYHLDLKEPFSYVDFMKRRFKTVLVPYLVWSLFYILHYTFLYHDTSLLRPFTAAYYLFFGLCSYQLYFMVILLWFYLLMPLWIAILRRITPLNLSLLLIAQIAFDYWSSFIFNPYGIENWLLKAFMVNRLNYWVMHYFFIFLLGGWLAINYKAFLRFMEKRRTEIVLFFWISLAALLGYYYYLLSAKHYTAIEGINTAHQLCPAGIFYTIAASLFFFTIFTYQRYPDKLNPLLSILGRHSYFAYLAHPIAITYLSMLFERCGIIMTAPAAIVFYILIAVTAVTAAVIMRRIGNNIPIINMLTIGIYPKK